MRALHFAIATENLAIEQAKLPSHFKLAGFNLIQLMSAKTKVTKTKTALKHWQETYNLSDLKHDLHCGVVELGDSVSVSYYHDSSDSRGTSTIRSRLQ
jgi:hypothetical protein